MDNHSYRPTIPEPSVAGSAPGWALGLGVIMLVTVIGSAVAYRAFRHSAQPAPTAAPELTSSPSSPQEVVDDLNAAVVKEPLPNTVAHEKSYMIPSRPTAAIPGSPEASAAMSVPPASAYSQQLIQHLSQVDPNQAKITPEQATALKQNLKDLAGQGAAAVPAIRQFLERNQDVNFDDPNGGNQVGYSSLRAGLFDTLKQIGGPEATDALVGTLRSTADPSEIAAIAKFLEEQAPGQYRADVVSAARDTLDQAARGQVQVRDTGALFQVLQNYGDASVVADLQKTMPQWHYYSTISLAGLPDGQGVAALTQSVQETAANKAPNTFALQMLAQMASQYPDAASALVDQAKQNQIPDRTWLKIVEGLAGDQYQLGKPPVDTVNPNFPPAGLKTYHIESGNQNFYSLPFNLYGTPDQAAQRLAVVDQLLAATQNPAAVQALQNARAVFSAPAPVRTP
jgi:hypothetical protein